MAGHHPQGPPELDDRSGGSTVFRYPLDVRFYEVDSLGVVFNMWYLGWCDEAMSAFLESIGYGYATLRARGLDAVLRKADLEWLDSLEAFQHAEVAVRVGQVGRTSFRLDFDINRVDLSRTEISRTDVGRSEVSGTDSERSEMTRTGIERGDIEGVDGSGRQRTRCAHAAITYVCVDIAGRKASPIPPDLRQVLVAGPRESVGAPN